MPAFGFFYLTDPSTIGAVLRYPQD